MSANEIILTAHSYFGGECIIRITEAGHEVVRDSRKVRDGYLHTSSDAPADITVALRDAMLTYAYSHDGLPGLGDSVQRYFAGLSLDECERIGNNNQRGMYAGLSS